MTAPTTVEESAPATQAEHEEPKYSHFVDKSRLVDASVMGFALITLCGKKLIPSRNPDKFPICPICREELESLGRILNNN